MLSRDWHCDGCGADFHSYDHGDPPCPYCGGRAVWVPGGGHISSEYAKGCDRTVRGLAADYGLSNLNTPSPSRLNRAMPLAAGSQIAPDRSLGMKHFAPGFASYFHPTQPTCGPSLVPSNQRMLQQVGVRLPVSGSIAGPSVRGRPGLNSRIEGSYRPK
jgi:hypothetical protein